MAHTTKGNPIPIIAGDCFEHLHQMTRDTVDAIVTDPPYGLEFMGKEWDRFRLDDPGTMRNRGEYIGSHGDITHQNETLQAAGRVEYGAGKRPMTARCTGCGKRDQYRNPHDCRPSARFVGEVIDPHAAPPSSVAFGEWTRLWALEAYRALKPGAYLIAFASSRTYHRMAAGLEDAGFDIRDQLQWLYGEGFPKGQNVAKAFDKAAGIDIGEGWEPTSDAAVEWEGWNTTLKPGHEPIALARKPLTQSVAANLLEHRVGTLNIDATRIPTTDDLSGSGAPPLTFGGQNARPFHDGAIPRGFDQHHGGRWPANVIVDEAAARMIDKGGSSRFFYCAKSAPGERNAGLPGGNPHPTVKPIDLMRWLIRLVTPAGGLVVDPFAGSGSTGIAAHLESREFIGIEKDAEAVAVARKRLDYWTRQGVLAL